MEKRCVTCGGSLEQLIPGYLKCEYCGRMYNNDADGSYADLEKIYREAIENQGQDTEEAIKNAQNIFEHLSGYKDSSSRVTMCYQKLSDIEVLREEKRLAEQRAEQEREIESKKEEERQKNRRIITFIVLAVIVIVIFVLVMRNRAILNGKENSYNLAVSLYESGEYTEAYDVFAQIKDYKDTNSYIVKIDELETTYNDAVKFYENGDIKQAKEKFSQIKEYKDSAKYIEMMEAEQLEEAYLEYGNGNYQKALELLDNISEESSYNSEASELREKIKQEVQMIEYEKAIELYDNGDMEGAQEVFIAINGFDKSEEYLEKIGEYFYEHALEVYSGKDYEQAVTVLGKIDNADEWNRYDEAQGLLDMIRDDYHAVIEKEAKSLLQTDGYDAVKQYVNEAVNSIFTGDEASELLNTLRPISLISLEPYDIIPCIYCRTEYEDSWDGTISPIKDNWGEVYDTGIYCSYGGPPRPKGRYVEYNVKDYSLLNGYIICLDEGKTSSRDGYIKIFGDDQVIYSSQSIKKGFQTERISLDISDYTILKIEFIGAEGYDNGCLVNSEIFK